MKPTKFNPATDAESWDLLPVVDFTPWFLGSDTDRLEIAAQLRGAATKSGFFYLAGHGIAEDVIKGAYNASAAFHGQSEAYKAKYDISNSKVHRGWASTEQTSSFSQDGKVVNNFYEAFDLSFEVEASDPRASQGYGLVGPNQWPDLMGFQDQVTSYYESVYDLGRELMGAFELSLGITPGSLLKHVNIPTSQLRLLKYFENDAPSDEFNAGISAHSDYECFTMLHTSGPGLQLLSYDGHWVEAPPLEGTFVVNIGDCLEALTGGLYRATQHRVVNLGKERFSMPFFFSVDFETKIEPLPEFSQDEALRKYPPFTAGEHLWARTIQTFPYLKHRYDAGELPVTFEVAEDNPFQRLSVEELAAKDSQSSTNQCFGYDSGLRPK